MVIFHENLHIKYAQLNRVINHLYIESLTHDMAVATGVAFEFV